MCPAMTVSNGSDVDLVGPVFEASSVTDAVVAVIRQHNTDVVVEPRGSYVRVLVPGRCFLDRRDVEELLGTEFRLPGDLEAIMPSFKGRMKLTAEEVVWTSRRAEEAGR
jgi:hypothetical protein